MLTLVLSFAGCVLTQSLQRTTEKHDGRGKLAAASVPLLPINGTWWCSCFQHRSPQSTSAMSFELVSHLGSFLTSPSLPPGPRAFPHRHIGPTTVCTLGSCMRFQTSSMFRLAEFLGMFVQRVFLQLHLHVVGLTADSDVGLPMFLHFFLLPSLA